LIGQSGCFLGTVSHYLLTMHPMPWIAGLGGGGLFAVAVIDSSMLPVPLPGSADFLLLFLTTRPFLSAMIASSMVLWAIAGSTIGGYLTWAAGRKGGVTTLDRIVPKRPLRRILRWTERNGRLSVAVAALLPPPIPLLPFVLAAGALGVPRGDFLLSFAAARALRFSFIAWLGFTYGRQVIGLWQRSLQGWTKPVLYVYLSLLVFGAALAGWRLVKNRRKSTRTTYARS